MRGSAFSIVGLATGSCLFLGNIMAGQLMDITISHGLGHIGAFIWGLVAMPCDFRSSSLPSWTMARTLVPRGWRGCREEAVAAPFFVVKGTKTSCNTIEFFPP